MRDPVMLGLQMILDSIVASVIWIRGAPNHLVNFISSRKEVDEEDSPTEVVFESPVYIDKKKQSKETEECPEFQEIFEAGNDLVIGVEYLELSPDEKAVIRIVGSATFSKQYRRRVYTLPDHSKYILIDNKRFFIRKAKVQS